MKNSQGNKKIKQYLEDLRKNEIFQKNLNELKKAKSKQKYKKLALKICDNFSVDWDLLHYVAEDNYDYEKWAKNVDMCVLGFDFDETFAEKPIKSKLEKKLHKMAYPTSIDIHKFATKRDILDFVEKNWKNIDNHLKFFRDGKKIIRQRKNKGRDDFIWKNRTMGIKKLITITNKLFEGNLGYEEIYKIINLEKKRRRKGI